MRGLGLKSEAEWRDYLQVRQEARPTFRLASGGHIRKGWVGRAWAIGSGRATLLLFAQVLAFQQSARFRSQPRVKVGRGLAQLLQGG